MSGGRLSKPVGRGESHRGTLLATTSPSLCSSLRFSCLVKAFAGRRTQPRNLVQVQSMHTKWKVSWVKSMSPPPTPLDPRPHRRLLPNRLPKFRNRRVSVQRTQAYINWRLLLPSSVGGTSSGCMQKRKLTLQVEVLEEI
jgi:hypothetical protein